MTIMYFQKNVFCLIISSLGRVVEIDRDGLCVYIYACLCVCVYVCVCVCAFIMCLCIQTFSSIFFFLSSFRSVVAVVIYSYIITNTVKCQQCNTVIFKSIQQSKERQLTVWNSASRFCDSRHRRLRPSSWYLKVDSGRSSLPTANSKHTVKNNSTGRNQLT